MIVVALDGNYGAVQDLHANATKSVGGVPSWDWWIDRCEEVEREGDHDTARLGIEFAYAAGNVEPWGNLSDRDYDRLRPIRERLRAD